MKIVPRPSYTCIHCRKPGTEDIFESVKWSNKTGVCLRCAEELDLNPMAHTEMTAKDYYDEKVDQYKEGK